MMTAIVIKSICKGRRALTALRLSTRSGEVAAKIRSIAPYALMELILPGGSVMALLLWLYRQRKKASVLATEEILALL
jgi:hypothetical protein